MHDMMEGLGFANTNAGFFNAMMELRNALYTGLLAAGATETGSGCGFGALDCGGVIGKIHHEVVIEEVTLLGLRELELDKTRDLALLEAEAQEPLAPELGALHKFLKEHSEWELLEYESPAVCGEECPDGGQLVTLRWQDQYTCDLTIATGDASEV